MTKETAMKILKELHDKSLYSERTALETIVPELKESEDERIRKDLLAFIKAPYVYDFIVHDRVDPWISWLEKQGEQNQKWSEKDEEMANDIIEGCLSSEKAYYIAHTSEEIADWLKSIKDRVKGKEE